MATFTKRNDDKFYGVTFVAQHFCGELFLRALWNFFPTKSNQIALVYKLN